MKQYQFKDVLYMNKKSAIIVEIKESKDVGIIERAVISGCGKGNVFSFTHNKGLKVKMGIKKRNVKSLFANTYIIKVNERTCFLKDKAGNSLLYFCVEGDIDGKKVRIEENWSNEIEVKIDQVHIATIKTNVFTLKTTIFIEDNISESSISFAVTVLVYFMYKIYNNESEMIENILFD